MKDTELNQKLIEDWMMMTEQPIHYTKVCDAQFNREDYPHLRMIFRRMVTKGIVEPTGSKDGYYRFVQNHAKPLDWQNYSVKSDSGLILPFDLRKWCMIYPDTTVVVAGSKSSGKTGFLYRTIVLNMNSETHKVKLLTNLEGGLGMLRDRFNAMDEAIPQPAPFDVIQVTENFHDYIKDSCTIYIVDYLDVPDGESFYKVGHWIQKIDRKLAGLNSMAVVGVQKPSNRDTAFGGEQTMKAATLYIALDTGILKLVDVKVPADKKVNPKNMKFQFKYEDEGTKFTNIQPYYGI